MLHKIYKIFRNTLLLIVGLILLLAFLVNLTPVQNFLVREAAHILADKLKTNVGIKHVRIDFLNHVVLQGLYIEDKHKDTLLYADEARVRISDWFIFKKDKPVIRYVGLHNAYANLYRTHASNEWNYQFIIDAFDTGKKDTTKKQNEFELDLKKLDITHTRFRMSNAWVGNDYAVAVGSLQVDAKEVDIKKKILSINSINIATADVLYKDYDGGKPKSKKKKINSIDTTAFNTANWAFTIKKISLKNSAFHFDADDDAPTPNVFDPAHIGVTAIGIEATNLTIVKDTIKGDIASFVAKERCGLMVRKFHAKVSVSPNASICKDLYLETNRSKLKHYYAMHYERFPDFKDYINKVVMVGQLEDSYLSSADVAFFAPQLKPYPTNISLSGNVAGTVDSLVAHDIALSDGGNFIKGDISMIGLPDIYTTYIHFTNGSLLTTSGYVYKYAPQLKNDPNIDFNALSFVSYQGDFSGYIDNFAANGILKTNLGNIRSNVKLKMQDFNAKNAVYSGNIISEGFNIGKLIKQPILGSIALNVAVSGQTFDPNNASVNLKGKINRFDVNDYSYQNIDVEGVLAKKKFDGKVLVTDPNLALAFYGNIDFSQPQLHINATANLLQSNLQALKFTKDSVLATADFDLNYVGNNIDDFSGFAKLYNINLVRNKNRIDIDSVNLQSTTADGKKLLVLESNDVTARIAGNYQLTSLPYSVQYFVAGYLPNYIKKPTQYAPEQNLTFNIETKTVDSLLAVIAPNIRGFNNTKLNGALNTFEQTLTLNGQIPYGYVNGVELNKVTIDGKGNFRQLILNADVEKISISDDLLSASMTINTSLGNDSLSFNIASSSDDAIGNATLNGHAFARGDSLFMRLLPSEFYLNKVRWEIPTGNSIVFAKDYLYIRNLFLNAGLQQIGVHTTQEWSEQKLNIDIKQLDLSMLGNLAGISGYQPDGRINGSINIDHIFNGINIESKLVASDVKFGTDTMGTVNIFGRYDGKKKIVTLDPKSGIYNGGASIRPSGSISFDSTDNQLLEGTLQFVEADIAWLSPFVEDFLSQMSGTVNGTIKIGGSAAKPDVNGNILLKEIATKVDIIGTSYKLHGGVIKVSNDFIDFGTLTVFDQYNNSATLTGGIRHERFRNMRFERVLATSPEFEVINLKDYENSTFYGNLIANVSSLTLTGPFDDLRMNIRATPAQRSHIFIPVKTDNDINTYSYVSFKSYGTDKVINKKAKNKFSLSISGDMNPLAEITLVLDPATGDMINARGNGNITLNVPAGDDIKMYGNFDIDEGNYTFTFKQLYFKRNFIINAGSKIAFNGPLNNTSLNINAIYTTKSRLIDLLQSNETDKLPDAELRDAKTAQNVNVLLYMNGSLSEPKLSFNIELPEKRSYGTLAYQKLVKLNQNDRELFDQVAALLLINSFVPPEGVTGSTALSGGINNVSEILSTTASSQLTNIVNKLLGDPNLAVELKYKNYNLSDPSGGINRNQVSVNVRKTLFKDRLIVELGSAYDWGRPTASNNNSSNLNLAGDFRVQYLLSEDGRVRLNAFRISNYDVLVNDNIYRGGVGISYRKTFNNLYEMFHSRKRITPTQKEESPKDTGQTKGTL